MNSLTSIISRRFSNATLLLSVLLLTPACGRDVPFFCELTGNCVSVIEFCGNGELNQGEECDDGNVAAQDGCSPLCLIETPPNCGDGELNDLEECDDGNLISGDGCDENCQIEQPPACGDGEVNTDEECDDGNLVPGDGCDENCRIEPPAACGDGRLDPEEECDDGNRTNGDGCDENCDIEAPPSCGDGELTDDEECDDGNQIPGDGCDENCRIERPAICGDGNLDPGEQCDDGNLINGDGCDDDCQIEPPARCGDGNLDPGEQCDDGNLMSGDGCDEDCRIERMPICGNNRLELGEECDDGNLRNGDGCDENCRIEASPLCGNGQLDPGELCDDGNTINGDGCDENCRTETPPMCGDGVIDAGEQCDDGNTRPGDGCDENCQVEVPPQCGNGRLEPGEQCDDGNLISGDGCDANCQLEPPAACGDGNLDPGEQCDDGNIVSGDGCDALCQTEQCSVDQDLGSLVPGMTAVQLMDISNQSDDVDACGQGRDRVFRFELTQASSELQLEIMQVGRHRYGLFRDTSPISCTDSLSWCDSFNGAAAAQTTFTGLSAGIYLLIVEEEAPGTASPTSIALTVLLPLPACGDGNLDMGEVCDDGNTTDGDGCSADCRSDETCGNRIVDSSVGEVCDDGNTMSGDGCAGDCRSSEFCGNGVIDPGLGEVCDDGNVFNGDGCSADCRSNETCGNGILDSVNGETCDDGNLISNDGCDSSCQTEIGMCTIDEDLGTLQGGVPVSRSPNIAASGDQWTTDCAMSGSEFVYTFNVPRRSDILVQFTQNGHHNLGLYRENEVTQTCNARNGVCAATGVNDSLNINFRGRPPGRYFLIIESNGQSLAGTGNISLLLEGCSPNPELGVLRIGSNLQTTVSTNIGNNAFAASCSGQSGNERVIAFSVPQMMDIDLQWTQSGDHVFGLYEEDGGNCDETPISCFDPVGAATGFTTFPRVAPGDYLILLDAVDPGDEGSVTFRLTGR